MRLSSIVASVAVIGAASVSIVGSALAPATAPELPTRPCVTDEGTSAFACVWDASERGNSKGRSFWIDSAGNLTYL